LTAELLAEHRTALTTASGQPTLPTLDNWETVREQFPLSRALVHMSAFFLASHPTPVRDAIERHRRGLDDNPIEYWFANQDTQEASVLAAASHYLEAQPTDIALTDSTTMGLGLLYGGLSVRPDQEILTTVHDHYSTDVSLRLRAQRTGASIRQIPLYRSIKNVSAEEIVATMMAAVRPNTRVIAVTWVHSGTGLKLPIRDMAMALNTINARRGEDDRALLCVDGVHGLGVENFTMDELGCDFFVAGTHKWLFGPRGTGLVWGHPTAWKAANAMIPTFNLDAYRIWTKDIPPKDLPMGHIMTPGGFHSFEHRWALGEAFRFHLAIGKARVTERIHALNDQLKKGLAAMSGVLLHTPISRNLSSGIVCFEVDGHAPYQVVHDLRQRGIVASVTPYATHYVRLAPSLLTTSADVDKTLQAVRTLLPRASR
jgi:selenocysteine lyase/cysteine desulfurase